jgi:hypothetical protein
MIFFRLDLALSVKYYVDHRLFCVNSPRIPCVQLYTPTIQDGSIIPGTLLSKIIQSKSSPLLCALSKAKYNPEYCNQNGIVDSLKLLLLIEHFTKPNSSDHQMAVMLTKAL